jgi:hypothetical protein
VLGDWDCHSLYEQYGVMPASSPIGGSHLPGCAGGNCPEQEDYETVTSYSRKQSRSLRKPSKSRSWNPVICFVILGWSQLTRGHLERRDRQISRDESITGFQMMHLAEARLAVAEKRWRQLRSPENFYRIVSRAGMRWHQATTRNGPEPGQRNSQRPTPRPRDDEAIELRANQRRPMSRLPGKLSDG